MVSKFPGFVWITVVQEMKKEFGNNSSKYRRNKTKKQRKEKQLEQKVSGYKSRSKGRSIAGCRLLLRTLKVRVDGRDLILFCVVVFP